MARRSFGGRSPHGGSGRRAHVLLPLLAMAVAVIGAGVVALGSVGRAPEPGSPPSPAPAADVAASAPTPDQQGTAPEEPAAGGTAGEDPLDFDPYSPTAVAVAMSQRVFPEGRAENIILTRDTPSGDALAAGGLIGLFDTTLLLTDSSELSTETAAEIDRLGRPNVHILGGDQAISVATQQRLEAAGHMVHRHAGPAQADTAVNIAELHFPSAATAVLIRLPDRAGDAVQALADSLAASGLSSAREVPILLTASDSLAAATATHLARSAIGEVVIVGDETQVGEQVTRELEALGVAWTRWAGPDRYATAVAVAEHRGFASLDDAEVALLVEGERETVWPGGLLGAVLAARQDGPVLLTAGDELPEATADYLRASALDNVPVLCTPGVSAAACAAANDLADGGAAGNAGG